MVAIDHQKISPNEVWTRVQLLMCNMFVHEVFKHADLVKRTRHGSLIYKKLQFAQAITKVIVGWIAIGHTTSQSELCPSPSLRGISSYIKLCCVMLNTHTHIHTHSHTHTYIHTHTHSAYKF